MNVVLHKLSKCDDGTIALRVSIGGNSEETFHAAYDGHDSKHKYCSVDHELFMQLSNLAHKRFGNCTVYQLELMGIIEAFVATEVPPDLPVILGTTRFCTFKPGPLRILWNKFWISLYGIGLYRSPVWPRGEDST